MKKKIISQFMSYFFVALLLAHECNTCSSRVRGNIPGSGPQQQGPRIVETAIVANNNPDRGHRQDGVAETAVVENTVKKEKKPVVANQGKKDEGTKTKIMEIDVEYSPGGTTVTWVMDTKQITDEVTGYEIKITKTDGEGEETEEFCDGRDCKSKKFDKKLSSGDYRAQVVAFAGEQLIDRTLMSAGFKISKKKDNGHAISTISITKYKVGQKIKVEFTIDKSVEEISSIHHSMIGIRRPNEKERIARGMCGFPKCRSAGIETPLDDEFYVVDIVARGGGGKELPLTKLRAGFKAQNSE